MNSFSWLFRSDLVRFRAKKAPTMRATTPIRMMTRPTSPTCQIRLKSERAPITTNRKIAAMAQMWLTTVPTRCISVLVVLTKYRPNTSKAMGALIGSTSPEKRPAHTPAERGSCAARRRPPSGIDRTGVSPRSRRPAPRRRPARSGSPPRRPRSPRRPRPVQWS